MTTQQRTICAAAVQAAPVLLERDQTIAKACALIREAGGNGADLIAFPEGFLPGHPDWFHFHLATGAAASRMNVRLAQAAVEVPGPCLEPIYAAARDAGAYVVLGVCERRRDSVGMLFNTQVFISPTGEYLGKHQKLVPTFTERLVHTGGDAETLGPFGTAFGPCSSLICGENSNPLAIFAMIAESTSVHVMSWPSHISHMAGKLPVRSGLAARAFAQMSKAYVVSACGTLTDETIAALEVSAEDAEWLRAPDVCGGSCIVAPNTNVIAGPMGPEEGIIYAELDLDAIIGPKLFADVAGSYNRPDVFQLRVGPGSQRLYERVRAGADEPNGTDAVSGPQPAGPRPLAPQPPGAAQVAAPIGRA